ncbi:MAG: protein translocase subunit SecD [Clostridia bacterium]|nr:protein translocase subunit SecD [Clostridia bacterium]
MNKNSGKLKSRGLTKGWSIAILVIFAILMILGTVFAFVPLNEGQLGIYDYDNFLGQIKLGLDVKGGVYAVFNIDYDDFVENKYEGDKTKKEEVDYAFDNAVKGTVSRLTDLLTSKGYTEAQVTVNGNGQEQKIRVEVPDVNEPEEIFDLIAKPATLTMYEANVNSSTGEITKANDTLLVSGSDIQMANVNMQDGKYVIQLKFNSNGTKKFADATSQLSGKRLGIFLDGKGLMAPQVNETISNGQAVITGDYTYEEAYAYAVKIQSGALGVKLSTASSSVISATLGQDALSHGLIAGGVGLLLIFVIMIARYRMLGVAASIALFFFALTYLFILSIFPWVQLTLPGIAGILLSIGMAVDANVIIFERIRELMSGNSERDIRATINQGFKNSLSAIIDGNVTTLIGAIVLAIIATSSIKGFAITLLIGIIVSLISALLVSRLIIKCFLAFNDQSTKLYGLEVKDVDYTIDYKNNDNKKLISEPATDEYLSVEKTKRNKKEKNNEEANTLNNGINTAEVNA